MSSDLHDLALYALGLATGVVLTTQAYNRQNIHIIDHDETAVDRRGMR